MHRILLALALSAAAMPAAAMEAETMSCADFMMLDEGGRTAVVVGWDGRARGVLAVADTVKDGSAEAVRRLRPDQQECVSLRFLQGMSVAETAAVLGRSEGAVKALQGRALRNLSRTLPAHVQG